MNITEIRERMKRRFGDSQCIKDIWAAWLAYGPQLKFTYGLTLMPKKVYYKHALSKNNQIKIINRHLNKTELIAANDRFFILLNKIVYKNAYKRFGKNIKAVITIEGQKSYKDLHSHFAFEKPSNMNSLQFSKCVLKALRLSGEFEIENPNYKPNFDSIDKKNSYKLDLIDCDWLHYITKELDKKTVQNLYIPS